MKTEKEPKEMIDWVNNHLPKDKINELAKRYDEIKEDYRRILSDSKLKEEVDEHYIVEAVHELNEKDFFEFHRIYYPFLDLQITQIKSVDDIWDLITKSAKGRFEYSTFEKAFSKSSKELKSVPENIIWIIINRLANDEDKKIISLEIQNQIFMLQMKMELNAIQQFVADKDDLFKVEIYLNRVADAMLKGGDSPKVVYRKIVELLRNRQKPMYGRFFPNE